MLEYSTVDSTAFRSDRLVSARRHFVGTLLLARSFLLDSEAQNNQRKTFPQEGTEAVPVTSSPHKPTIPTARADEACFLVEDPVGLIVDLSARVLVTQDARQGYLIHAPPAQNEAACVYGIVYGVYGEEAAVGPAHVQDMSEYMEQHAVSRLIGAPPGYVGHEAG